MVTQLGRNELHGCDMRRLIPTGMIFIYWWKVNTFSGPLQIPCHITYVPKNEQACQLSSRLARLLELVRPACDQWQNEFLTNQLRLLRESELPINDSPGCPPIGEPMTNFIRQKAQVWVRFKNPCK